MKKRIVSAVLTLLLSFALGFSAFAAISIPKQTDRFFVNDYAGILSEEAQKKICEQGEKLYNATKAQVVAVTVKNLGGYVIEDYAYEMATKWKLGDKQKDNGLILLLSVEDRKVRIEVGSGLEGALPDSKTGRILDTYGVDYFKNDEFEEGILSVYNSLINEVYIEYELEPDGNYEPVEEESGSGIALLIIFFLIIAFNIWSAKRGRPGIRFFPFGFGGGGFSGGSGSGGFRGGGGGFSGGGGGFSGGGSSRGF